MEGFDWDCSNAIILLKCTAIIIHLFILLQSVDYLMKHDGLHLFKSEYLLRTLDYRSDLLEFCSLDS